MVPVNEFREENQEISDLSAVLTTLLTNDTIMANPVVCELFARFHDKLDAHLNHEDRAAYGDLLRHRGKDAAKLASEFLENTHELRKIVSLYNRKWCNGKNEADVASFKQETTDLFGLVEQRLQQEESKLFPILEGS
jgi:hemerythrin-like domain-containing protein